MLVLLRPLSPDPNPQPPSLVTFGPAPGDPIAIFGGKPDVIQSTPNFGVGFYPSHTHFSPRATHQIPAPLLIGTALKGEERIDEIFKNVSTASR
jgi:hypothetical protein